MRRYTKMMFVALCVGLVSTACGEDASDDAGEVKSGEVQLGTEVAAAGKADGAIFQGEILPGETQFGGFTAREAYHAWTISGVEGAAIELSAEAQGREDLVMLVYENTDGGYELNTYNDDCTRGTLDPCLSGTFSNDAEHLVVVTTWRYAFRGIPAPAQYALAYTCDDCAPTCEGDDDFDYIGNSPRECTAILFQCDEGSEAFFNECGCGCAPAQPNECRDDVEYLGDADQCATIRFFCADGFQPFFDECGCGCEPEGDVPTCEGDDDYSYVNEDPQQCAAIRFVCDQGFEPFFNECGCGCRPQPQTECVVTGCSGQICASEHLASTCEWREEYACYRSATCAVQADGNCGWTQTDELAECIENARL